MTESIKLPRTEELEREIGEPERAERMVQKLFSLTPDLFIIMDSKGFTKRCNLAVEKITGYTERDISMVPYTELVHPEDREMVASKLNDDTGGNLACYLEYRFLCKNGTYKWINWSVVVDSDEGLIYCMGRDVTDKKQYEEELRRSEERFVSAFDNAPAGMALTRLEDGMILRFNQCLSESMGYTSKEVVGQQTIKLNMWVDLGDREKVVEGLREHGMVRNMEVKLGKKQGVMIALVSAHPFEYEGEHCILWTVMNITELKALQEEMARLDQLNLVGEMAASIGHEVRNPLTTVRGYLQLLGSREEFSGVKQQFELMIDELDRANAIITEFLTMAKNWIVEVKVINLNKIIGQIVPLLQADALNKGKQLKVQLAEIPDLLLDEKEMRQLILNLAKNGFEAMEDGGTLTVMTYEEDKSIVLAVHDQGSGIPKEKQNKIGRPFFTTKENGTGLGLPVCYSIAARHNGCLSFQTGPEGTTFYLKFGKELT